MAISAPDFSRIDTKAIVEAVEKALPDGLQLRHSSKSQMGGEEYHFGDVREFLGTNGFANSYQYTIPLFYTQGSLAFANLLSDGTLAFVEGTNTACKVYNRFVGNTIVTNGTFHALLFFRDERPELWAEAKQKLTVLLSNPSFERVVADSHIFEGYPTEWKSESSWDDIRRTDPGITFTNPISEE